MKLNTTTKTILAGILLIAFLVLIIEFVNPMIEKRYAPQKNKVSLNK